MKARSRLKIDAPEVAILPEKPVVIRSAAQVPSFTAHTPLKRDTLHRSLPNLPIAMEAHTAHLGTFFISLIFYIIVYFILTKVQPGQIANWLLPHSYLPFQISLFLANWFLASFIWLNTRRGYLTALAIQLPIFLTLQKVDEAGKIGLGLAVLFVIIELLITYLEKSSSAHANFHQNPSSRRRRARA